MSNNPFDWLDSGFRKIGEAVSNAAYGLKNIAGGALERAVGEETAEEIKKIPAIPYKVGKKTSQIASRTVTTAVDFPLEVINNTAAYIYANNYASPVTPINTGKGAMLTRDKGPGYKAPSAEPLEQLVGLVSNTTIGELVKDVLPGGEKVDIGKGWFVAGDTREDINTKKKELYPSIYGHSFTVGRTFASALADNGIITPDSTAWNVISGTVDAGWTLVADGTNWIPAGAVANIGKIDIPLTAAARAGKRAKVTTTLRPGAAKIIDEAVEAGRLVMNEAGLIDNGRRTVNPNNWEAFKLTPNGQKWLDGFVGEKSGSAAEIWRKSLGQIPPVTANRLAKAGTYDEVLTVMDDAVYGADPLVHVRIMPGIDPRPIVTKIGATIKGRSGRYKLFDTLPESTDFPLNNPTKAIRNADGVMGVLEVPNDIRDGLINKLIGVMDGDSETAIFDWLDEFEKTVVRTQLEKWNFSEDEIARMATWRKRYTESISGFVTDTAGSSVPLEWLVGGPLGGYGPLLISQTLRVNPVLIDPVDLRTISDRLGPIRSKLEKWRRSVTETVVDPETGKEIVLDTRPNKWVNTPVVAAETAGDIVDYVQARVWKPNILIRPRYLIRTLPEENLRLFASGIFDHHYQYIAQLFTNRNSVDLYGNVVMTSRKAAQLEAQANEAGRVIRAMEGRLAQGQTTYRGKAINKIIGEQTSFIDDVNKRLAIFDERIDKELTSLDDSLLRGLPNRTSDLMLHPSAISGMVKRGELMKVERAVNPDLWAKGMAQRLAERSSNPYYREIAKMVKEGMRPDEIARRFHSGNLRSVLDEYISKLGNKNPDYVWDLNGVRNFVQKNLDDINIYTLNGDPELLEAMIKNKYDGQALSTAKGFQTSAIRRGDESVAGYDPNRILKKYIKDKYAQSSDPSVPTMVNYFPSIFDEGSRLKTARDRMTARYDALLNLFWDGIYGASSDTLNRNPLWQQAKWQRVVELVPVMSKSEAEKLVANLRNTKLAKTLKDDIEELAATASGEMSVDEVETLAELFAARFTKETFFDASRKTKFGAAHRKFFPFFDAFVELSGSALKFATNPKVLHRADQAISELRQNTFLGQDIDGDGDREPFLYRDPVSGEEMYAIAPSGGFLKDFRKMGGQFTIGNTLSGLSLVTTMYPGVSPWVAFPVVKMLPDTKEFDKLRELVAPYGIPDLSDSSILQYVLPGATEQVMRILGSNGIELFSDVEERQKYMQTVIRAMQVMRTVKDYDPGTPGQQGPTGYQLTDEWVNDSKELGTKIYGIVGLAGLFLPGAPIAQYFAKTNKGNVLFGILTQRWQQIDKEGDKLNLDYQDKLDWIVSEIGSENIVALLQPITDRAIGGSTSTREFYDWYRENQSVVDKYRSVGGYFSPKPGELDPDVWLIQKIASDVKYKDPDQFAKNLDSAVANFVYNRNIRAYENSIPANLRGTPEADDALATRKKEVQQQVKMAYPNWDRASAATLARQERARQIYEIRQFVNEPSQQENEVVLAAKEYLKFRDDNVEFAKANSSKINDENWKTMTANQGAVALRNGLWAEGERLAEEVPGFVNLWQNILSREFISVDVEE